jgi:VanZ family protein
MPSNDLLKIKNIDKAYHSIAYFALGITWLFTYYKKPEKKYLIVICCIIFGMIIEILQYTLTDYRSGDYLDVIANSCAVLLSLLIFNFFSKKKPIN